MTTLTDSSPKVAAFLRNLALDPGLLEAFTENREDVLDDLALTAVEREYLLTVGEQDLRSELDAGEPNMGSRLHPTEPNMGSRTKATEPNMGTGARQSSPRSGS